MAELKNWCHSQIDEKVVEPNSGLGKAITYMLRHWAKLTRFLQVEGAPLDNNLCERALKRAILPTSQKRPVLQDPARRSGGRSVHEPDPHLPACRDQPLGLSDVVAQKHRTSPKVAPRLFALEISTDMTSAGRRHST
jgi:hypothetical protein